MSIVTIQLRKNNLYVNGKVVRFDNGEELLLRDTEQLSDTLTDKYHLLKKGERLDQLAWKYYRHVAKDAAKFWWIIADTNNIFNPMELQQYVGTDLVIPNLTKALIRL